MSFLSSLRAVTKVRKQQANEPPPMTCQKWVGTMQCHTQLGVSMKFATQVLPPILTRKRCADPA